MRYLESLGVLSLLNWQCVCVFIYARVMHFSIEVVLLLLLSRFSRVQLCATPGTAAYQAPPSMGFSRQEYWSGLPFPSLSSVQFSRSVVSDSPQPHRLLPTRLLCPWDFPGRNTGVGCHCLLHAINLDLPKEGSAYSSFFPPLAVPGSMWFQFSIIKIVV